MRSKSRLIACVYFYFVCILSVKTLQFSSQQPTEKEHLSQIIMCTPVCAALGYLPQLEFDEEVARKDAEVYHSLCFCRCFREVHLLWCIFISFLRAFLATSFPGLDPRALVVIIIFMIVIIIERV